MVDASLDARLAEARAQGHSWDEISQFMGERRDAARKEGYSDDEIDKFLGFNANSDLIGNLTAAARGNLQANAGKPAKGPEVSNAMDAFINGLEASSGGLVTRGKLPEQEMSTDPGFAQRIAHGAGVITGDIPAMVAGAIMGGGAAGAGTIEAGPVAIPAATLGAGAGAMALPEAIKREYIDALQNGKVKNARDFVERQMGVWWNTAKQAIVGGVTGGTGKVVGAGMKVAGYGALSRVAGTTSAELATMTSLGAAMEGRLPTREEFIDGAVLLAGFHAATGAASLGRGALGSIVQNLQNHWASTGEAPIDTIRRAQEDPAFRLSLVSPPVPDAPPGSSRTDAGIFGDFVVARDPDPQLLTGLELPPGVTFGESARTDANDSPIETTMHLADEDNNPIVSAKMTQLDTKMWNVSELESEGGIQGITKPTGRPTGRPPKYDWSPERLEELRDLVMKGTRVADIAAKFNIPVASILSRMRQELIRSKLTMQGSKQSAENAALATKIVSMREKNMSFSEIAEALSRSEGRQITRNMVSSLVRRARVAGKSERGEPYRPELHAGEEVGDPEYERALARYQESIQGIMGSSGEWDPETAFFANMAKHAQDQGGRLMTGMVGKDDLPAATMDKLEEAGLLEPVKTGKGMIYQIHSAQMPPDNGVYPTEGNSPSLGRPHSQLAQTGDANVDAVLNRPKVKEAIDNPKIDRTKDVPDFAGASGPPDDLGTHIDRHIPRRVTLNGVTFDPAIPLNIHEQVERSKMEELIPEFVEAALAKRKPTEEGGEVTAPSKEEMATIRKEAERKAYEIAHKDYATVAEHSWLRSHNIPTDQYEAMFDEWGKSIDSYNPENLPDDLYMLNKHGPADLGPQAVVEQGQPTGEAGTEGLPAAASVKPRLPSAMTQIADANPWTGTVQEAREAVLSRMGDRPGPSMWQRVRDGWFEFYRQMFNPQHPVNLMTEAIRQGGSLTQFNNPNFMYRMAELAPDRGMYAIQRRMIRLDGTVTGPGLNDILDRFPLKADRDRFWSYAISRWAIEKAQQMKETGVDLAAAHAVVDFERIGATVVPGIDPRGLARSLGVTINDVTPGHPEEMVTNMFGPHYNPARRIVNMLPPGHAFYGRLGQSMTYDVVLAHEMGHALADRLGVMAGVPGLTPAEAEALRQELTLHSRRYKPEWWQNKVPVAAGQQVHIRKEGELMADAMATWMTEPGARARMPVFQRILQDRGVFQDLTNLAGGVPAELGTPISRAFEDLVDYQNATLGWLRDSGIINTEQFIKLQAENAARIPGYREPQVVQREGRVKGPGPGQTAFDPVKGFFGSDTKIENIQKSLLQDTFLRMSLALRNVANRNTFDSLAQIQMAGRVREPARKITLTDKEVSDILNASTADPVTRSALSTPGSVDIWRVLGQGVKPNEALIFRDGKIEKWETVDPQFMRYVKGLDEGSRSVLISMVSKMAKALRAGVVLNPAFPVRLLSYDVPWQFIVKPGFRNVLQTAYLGFRHVFAQSPLWDQWMRSGFAERIFDGATKNQYITDVLNDRRSDPSRLDGVMNAVISPYHGLRWWAQSLSQVMRVGRYVQGVQQGESPIQAAAASSDFAFHRAGFGGPVGKGLNSTMPFFLAYLNSLEQTFRSQFGIGRTITGERFNPVHFTAKALGLITLPMLYQYFAYKDEDWYKAAPDWQKDNGLFLHWGEGDGAHTMYFKLPPLISYFYGGLPRRMVASFQSENPGAEMSKAWEGALFSLAPGSFMWTALAPIVEKLFNHSFFRDQPLVPDDVKRNFSPQNQFNHYSTEAAKGLSRFLSDIPILKDMKLSPPEIDNFIQGWSGTMGEAAVRSAEHLAQQSGLLKNDKPAMHFPEDYPLFRSWFSRYPSASAQPIKDFFDRMTQYEQIHGDLVKAMSAGNIDEFRGILGQHPQLGAFHSFKLRGTNAMEASTVPNIHEFSNSLRDAQAGGDRDTARGVIMADRAMKKMRQFAVTVEQVRVGSDLSSEVRALRQEGINIGPSGVNINANDKRQILDQLYATMQSVAEEGIKRMDKAGMR